MALAVRQPRRRGRLIVSHGGGVDHGRSGGGYSGKTTVFAPFTITRSAR